MEKLTGTWEGEFTFNYGTESEPEIEYFAFRMELVESEGIISGTCEDFNPQIGKATITGFIDDDFLSFVKKFEKPAHASDRPAFIDEIQPLTQDIHFYGNFDHKDPAFVGIWEVTVAEEKVGYSNEYIEENRTGSWYIRKTQNHFCQ